MKRFDYEMLYKAMKKRGVSIGSLAKQIGVEKAAVQEYVEGRALPSVDRLAKIAEVLQLGMTEICGLLRYVPYGVDRETLGRFIELCRRGNLRASSVLGELIKGYVYGAEGERAERERYRARAKGHRGAVEGVGQEPGASDNRGQAGFHVPAPALGGEVSPVAGEPRVQ